MEIRELHDDGENEDHSKDAQEEEGEEEEEIPPLVWNGGVLQLAALCKMVSAGLRATSRARPWSMSLLHYKNLTEK